MKEKKLQLDSRSRGSSHPIWTRGEREILPVDSRRRGRSHEAIHHPPAEDPKGTATGRGGAEIEKKVEEEILQRTGFLPSSRRSPRPPQRRTRDRNEDVMEKRTWIVFTVGAEPHIPWARRRQRTSVAPRPSRRSSRRSGSCVVPDVYGGGTAFGRAHPFRHSRPASLGLFGDRLAAVRGPFPPGVNATSDLHKHHGFPER